MEIRTPKLCWSRYLFRWIDRFRRFDVVSKGEFTVSIISIRDNTRFRHFRSEGTSDACLQARHPVDVRHAPTFYCYAWCRVRTREDNRDADCQSFPAPHDILRYILNTEFEYQIINIAMFKIIIILIVSFLECTVQFFVPEEIFFLRQNCVCHNF